MATEPLGTAQAHDSPTVRQQSVFFENRVGQLLRLTRLFDGTGIRILAVSVVNSVDCAICRMILDDPDLAYDVMSNARFQSSEAELLVVSLPHGKRALLQTWARPYQPDAAHQRPAHVVALSPEDVLDASPHR